MRCLPALLSTAVLITICASAQERPAAQPLLILDGQTIDRSTLAGPEPALRSKLRSLVIAQEKFWADHGTYTTDVSQLGLFSAAPGGVDSTWVQVLFAGGRSWSGRATYRGKVAKSCVIYVGKASDFPAPPVTERDSVRAREEGSPACDSF